MTSSKITAILGLLLAGTACGASSSGGGAGGAGGGAGGGSGECAALVANDVTTPVTVRFVNKTATDLFLTFANQYTCGAPPSFTITDPGGVDLRYDPGPCGTTCENAACACIQTYTCNQYAPVTRIIPQGAYESGWTGGVLEGRMVPTTCLVSGSCFGPPQVVACDALVKPKAYPLAFAAVGASAVTCVGAGCTCTPDAGGSCLLPQASDPVAGGAVVQGKGSLAAGGTSVDIVFE